MTDALITLWLIGMLFLLAAGCQWVGERIERTLKAHRERRDWLRENELRRW